MKKILNVNNTANTTGIRPLNLATEYSTTISGGDNLKLDTASLNLNSNILLNSSAALSLTLSAPYFFMIL